MSDLSSILRKKAYKLQMIGGNVKLNKPKQAYISMPSAWVEAQGLKPGEKILVYYRTDSPHIIVSTINAPPIREAL